MTKAWEELTSNPDQEIYTTFRSRWYVDHGVKIERFHDGTIEIKNVMRNGDHYTDITPMQRSYFSDYGWFSGAYKVCVDEFQRQLESAEFIYSTADESEKEVKAEKVIEKKSKLALYKNKLDDSLAGTDLNV